MSFTPRGFLSGIVTCSSAVLAGCFFVNWAVDHRIIWQSPTQSSIAAATAFYQDRVLEGATWFRPVLAGIAGVAITATTIKLAKGTTSRILFDGGSLFLLLAAVFIYLQNVSPSLNEIAKLPRVSDKLSQSAFGSITQIASAHAIIATVLTGVVMLQGAQAYSDRQVEKQVRKELTDAGIDPAYASLSNTAPTSPVNQNFGSKNGQGKGSGSGLAAPEDPSQSLRRSPRKKR